MNAKSLRVFGTPRGVGAALLVVLGGVGCGGTEVTFVSYWLDNGSPEPSKIAVLPFCFRGGVFQPVEGSAGLADAMSFGEGGLSGLTRVLAKEEAATLAGAFLAREWCETLGGH